MNSGEASGYPRVFRSTRYVYTVISPRSGGLMIGINLNPDHYCNFDCVYCDVQRAAKPDDTSINLDELHRELEQTLTDIVSGDIRQHASFRNVPASLLELRQVAFSGDGEPTLCPQFGDVVEIVAHVRAVRRLHYYRMVLITNGTDLSSPSVQSGLKLFTPSDEVWVKLDAGTQPFMHRINGNRASLDAVLAEIVQLGARRPVVIQSLFAELNGSPPTPAEITAYVQRLQQLQASGARISEVQLYSASRAPANPECRHLPLRNLSQIAQTVRAATGLKVMVH